MKFQIEVINTLSKWLTKSQIERLRVTTETYRRIREDLILQADWLTQRDQLISVIKHSKALAEALRNSGRSAQAEIQTVLPESKLGYLEMRQLPKKLGDFSEALRKNMSANREQNRRKNHAQLISMIDTITSETGMKPSRSDLSPFLEICTSIFNCLELKSPERSIKAFLDDRQLQKLTNRPSP